jgi:hypothetical protein
VYDPSYPPVAWAASTLSVAPTVKVSVPSVAKSPVVMLFVKLSTVIVLAGATAAAPDVPVNVTALDGRVTEYVYPISPVTVNDEAVGDPLIPGEKVTPPPSVLVPAGANTTVPELAPATTCPNAISVPVVIVIGATIVAEAVVAPLVAVFCALEVNENPIITRARVKNFVELIICFCFNVVSFTVKYLEGFNNIIILTC